MNFNLEGKLKMNNEYVCFRHAVKAALEMGGAGNLIEIEIDEYGSEQDFRHTACVICEAEEAEEQRKIDESNRKRKYWKEDLITVCDSCLQASCWQGKFYCYLWKTAGIIQKTRAELQKLGREHESYWKTDEELG